MCHVSSCWCSMCVCVCVCECVCVCVCLFCVSLCVCVCPLQWWTWRTAARCSAVSPCLWRLWRLCRPSWRRRSKALIRPSSADTSGSRDQHVCDTSAGYSSRSRPKPAGLRLIKLRVALFSYRTLMCGVRQSLQELCLFVCFTVICLHFRIKVFFSHLMLVCVQLGCVVENWTWEFGVSLTLCTVWPTEHQTPAAQPAYFLFSTPRTLTG